MTTMENIVRPFVGGGGLAPSSTTLPPPKFPGTVQMSLGGAGGRTASWTFTGEGKVILTTDQNFRESSRISEKVHVENPNDSSQFVEFCRAKTVNFTPEKPSKDTPRQSTYDLSGGYHDLSGGANSSPQKSKYSYKYPTDTTCQSTGSPDKGCAG